jgi:Protein of unknown function (DUF5131)
VVAEDIGLPQHTFEVLTKRSDRVCNLSPKLSWPQNVWMGVSVEDKLIFDRTYRLYLDKEISSEAFGRFFRPIEERQKQLEEETSKLQADVDPLKIDSFSRDQVIITRISFKMHGMA